MSKIQNDDVKSLAQLTGAGGSASQLINDTKIYVTAKGLNKQLSQAIVDEDLGGGGQGGINYIDNNDFEIDASGWSITKNTYASAIPDSGFVSGGTSNTIVRSISSPLRSSASGLYTLAALGNQLIYNFTIDAADKGKVLQGSFDYSIASGAFSDDSVTVWVFDVTNSKFIQPTPYLLKNHSLPAERFPFEFQASIDSVSYRLVIHQAAASTAAIKFDNVSVGPQAKLYGSVVTDWVSYTPTVGLSTNTANINGKWRRVGDSIEVIASFELIGTPAAGSATISIPSGYVIDSTKLPAGSQSVNEGNSAFFGSGIWEDSGVGYKSLNVGYNSTTSILIYDTESGSSSALTAAKLANGDAVGISFKAPIVSWSSSQIMSHDSSTRPVEVRAYKDSGGAVTSGSPYVFTTIDYDTHGLYNVSNGRIEVKSPGYYKLEGLFTYSSAAWTAGDSNYVTLKKNGTLVQYIGTNDQQGTLTYVANCPFKAGIQLFAGDYLEIVPNFTGSKSSVAVAGLNWFFLTKSQGPSQIMASESMSADYTTTAGQSIGTGLGSPTIVNFDTKVWDTGLVTTGTSWKFQPLSSGEFDISTAVQFALTTSTLVANLHLYKNGSGYRRLCHTFKSSGSSDYTWIGGTTAIKLLSTDYIDIRVEHNSGGSYSLDTTAGANYISIKRVGNY